VLEKTKIRGVTLIEAVATLGIMSAVAVGTVMMSSQYTEDTRTIGAAEHMKTVSEAANRYVQDNRAAVMGQSTETSPALLTVSFLSSVGYLPPNFSSSNIFKQHVCALVLEPTAGTLNMLIVAESGETLDDVHLAHFASLIGASGGGRFASNAANIQGTGGGWSIPAATFDAKANHLGTRCDGVTPGPVQVAVGAPVHARWMSSSDTADPGFLSRDVVPGNPGANTMQTNINMGGNRIANLGKYTAGSACPSGTNDGEIGVGLRNEVLSCNAGNWERQGIAYWSDNVGAHSALPACNATKIGETRRVASTGGLYICNGIQWDAALNETNDFVLPRHLQVAGNATVSGTTNLHGETTVHAKLNANSGINLGAGQTIQSPGVMHIESTNDLHLKPWSNGSVVIGGGGGSGNLAANGSIAANGRISAGEYMYIHGNVTPDTVCTPNGLLGRTTQGLMLSCQSGKWSYLNAPPATGSGPDYGYIELGGGLKLYWQGYTVPSCVPDRGTVPDGMHFCSVYAPFAKPFDESVYFVNATGRDFAQGSIFFPYPEGSEMAFGIINSSRFGTTVHVNRVSGSGKDVEMLNFTILAIGK